MKTGILMRAGRQFGSIVSLGALMLVTACGQAVPSDPLPDLKNIDLGTAALSADNGLNLNGLNRNGLNMNGLNRNGLNLNGLNLNGLGTVDFKNWFNGDVATSSMVMKYLYGCAAAQGATLTWTNPTTLVKYTWTGVFGLATDWVSGNAPTVSEQQVVTACLAAHVNKYGVHVPIAVEGRSAKGVQIPIGAGELTTYSIREGCFFGNVFTGEGIYGGPDHASWDAKTSTARACVFDTKFKDSMSQCPPIYQTNYCSSVCQKDKTNTFYETCTINGKAYKALATRMRPAEQYRCGDGVCQFTESCGGGSNWDSCKIDCGLCP